MAMSSVKTPKFPQPKPVSKGSKRPGAGIGGKHPNHPKQHS